MSLRETAGVGAARSGTDLVTELVEQAQQGDRDAFGALYNLRFQDVHRFVVARFRDRQLAEDVVAETFVKAWERLAGLRHPERFDAWLFQIAYNAGTDVFRRRREAPIDLVPEPADPRSAGSPAARAELTDAQADLGRALEQLSDDQRLVLVLRFLRGLSHAEVARQLGRSEDATRALQHRALARMRRILTESEAHAA